VSFVQGMIFHSEVANSIITDNDTQFIREKFLDCCDDNNIRVDWAAVAHAHMNKQVEHANGIILQCLKSHILTRRAKMSMPGSAPELVSGLLGFPR
jgi:hypothetical protein